MSFLLRATYLCSNIAVGSAYANHSKQMISTFRENHSVYFIKTFFSTNPPDDLLAHQKQKKFLQSNTMTGHFIFGLPFKQNLLISCIYVPDVL